MARTTQKTVYVTGRGWVTRTVPKKSAKRGACSFFVQGVRPGETFYGEETSFPVSWRGRNAANRMVQRKGYRHAVLGLKCAAGSITIASCNSGKCELLAAGSMKSEHKHRGRGKFHRPIAGY